MVGFKTCFIFVAFCLNFKVFNLISRFLIGFRKFSTFLFYNCNFEVFDLICGFPSGFRWFPTFQFSVVIVLVFDTFLKFWWFKMFSMFRFFDLMAGPYETVQPKTGFRLFAFRLGGWPQRDCPAENQFLTFLLFDLNAGPWEALQPKTGIRFFGISSWGLGLDKFSSRKPVFDFSAFRLDGSHMNRKLVFDFSAVRLFDLMLN